MKYFFFHIRHQENLIKRKMKYSISLHRFHIIFIYWTLYEQTEKCLLFYGHNVECDIRNKFACWVMLKDPSGQFRTDKGKSQALMSFSSMNKMRSLADVEIISRLRWSAWHLKYWQLMLNLLFCCSIAMFRYAE